MDFIKHCYKQPFISKVILRADFGSSPLDRLDECKKFTDSIADLYPHVTPTKLIDVHVNIDNGTEGVKHEEQGTHWAFKREIDSNSQAVLAPTCLSLEFGPGEHKSFMTLFGQFTMLTTKLAEAYGERDFDRIGLRYVNEIRLPGKALDWENMISDDLVAATLSPTLKGGRLLRSMHQQMELHGEDHIQFTYGIFNTDYPAPVVQRHFILDVDCSRTGVIPKNEALACVKNLNHLANAVFERSIKEGLRDYMEIVT